MSDEVEEEEEIVVQKQISEILPPPPRRPKKLRIPRRQPSIVVPGRQIVFITPDKTTCVECTCFPKEDPYEKPKKLNPCQHSPLTLYELAAKVVDELKFPDAFNWSEEEVAEWMAVEVGLPEYRECVLDSHINGRRLLMLEDPSKLPEVNVHNFRHIKMITAKVRRLFKMDFVLFMRSIGLPPRKPLTHCTWFKSRTGPSWGIRQNWTRCDILRWMKIIHPEPIYRDHWDMVWYLKPDFPKVLFGRIPGAKTHELIPHYIYRKEVCKEYTVPRKFRFQTGIPEEAQLIWMERRPSAEPERKEEKKKVKMQVPKETRLAPQKISLKGLKGRELLLAKRKMANPKFLVQKTV